MKSALRASVMTVCEVCVDAIGGAVAATAGGADRLELCAELPVGGISPSIGLLRGVLAATPLPVMVMVRVRGGDFCFSAEEVAAMSAEIACLKDEGVAGVVIGGLTPQRAIDRAACQRWIEVARPLSVTFHRAFDWTSDPLAALDVLIDLGVDRVLTSGQQATAEAGMP